MGPGTNPHFLAVESWSAAAAELTFTPRAPGVTLGCTLRSLNIYVADHRMRAEPLADRSLEARYGDFVMSQQATPTEVDARRFALETAYGADPTPVRIGDTEGRSCELGPEVPDDDVDGRTPAVVVWSDAGIGHLIASSVLRAADLLMVARSI